MAFSEFEQKRIEKTVAAYVEGKRPQPHLRAQLDIEFRIRGQSVEIIETRAGYRADLGTLEHPVAKATYVKTKGWWRVFWRRADLKWHGYDPMPTVPTIGEFLKVVDADPYHCFWG